MAIWKQVFIMVAVIAILNAIGGCSSSGMLLEEPPFSTIRDKSENTSTQNSQVGLQKAKVKKNTNATTTLPVINILDFHGVLDNSNMLYSSVILAAAQVEPGSDQHAENKFTSSQPQISAMREFIQLHWQKILLAVSVFTVGAAAPGPSSLMILNVGISRGRGQAVAMSFGVVAGEFFWAIAVALGFVAVIKTSATLFVTLNVLFGLYLLFLAFKYVRSCLSSLSAISQNSSTTSSTLANGLKGLLITLTNPQMAIVWVATFSVSVEIVGQSQYFVVVIGICMVMAFAVYTGYALLFSTEKVSKAYAQMHRPFDLFIGLLFGLAAIKMLSIVTA